MPRRNLQQDGERIAVNALKETDVVVLDQQLEPQAHCDLLEIVCNVIDAHRDRLLETHELGGGAEEDE